MSVSVSLSRCAGFAAALLILGLAISPAQALGLRGLGVKVGLDLSQQDFRNVNQVQFAGNQFDTARLLVGGHIDIGSILIPDLHLVPSADVVFENDLRIFSIFMDFRYYFHKGDQTSGYAGGGLGANLLRFRNTDIVAPPSTETIALSIPIGFQTKLSGSLNWIGELKVVIGNEQDDSSIRFLTGFGFGGP